MAILFTAEVAKRLRVSKNKVLGWIKSGELRAVNVASSSSKIPHWRIGEEDLAAFERRRENGVSVRHGMLAP